MERGEVYLVNVALPNRTVPGGAPVPTPKFVVVLRGAQGTTNETEVPVVIASSDRRLPGQNLRRYEVSVGPADGFAHATIIDCRWPYSLEKVQIPPSTYRFQLGAAKMNEVSVGLVAGLQMYAPTPPASTAPPPPAGQSQTAAPASGS